MARGISGLAFVLSSFCSDAYCLVVSYSAILISVFRRSDHERVKLDSNIRLHKYVCLYANLCY